MIAPEILFALVAAVGFGIGDMWSAVPARRLNSRQVTFYELWMVFLLYWFFILVTQYSFPSINQEIIFGSIIGGLSLTVAIITLFKSLAVGKVGVVAPIFNADSLVAVLLGIIVFGEILVLQSYFGIVLVLIGVFLLGVDFKEFKKIRITEPGVVWALISMLSFGVTLASYNFLTEYLNAFETIVVVNTAAVLMLTFSSFKTMEYLKFNVEKTVLLHLFGISLLIIVSVFSLVYAFSLSSLSVPAVIAGSSPLVSVMLAKLFFKEDLKTIQYIGSFVVVLGIIFLSL